MLQFNDPTIVADLDKLFSSQLHYEIRNNPEEVKKRALADPQISAIISDPAMRLILDQIQEDPQALRE